MAAQLYTTTDLIASIKRRAMIPTSQTTFQTADFLALADEELQLGLLPMLRKVREEFYVTNDDQSLVSGTDAYSIPERASGLILRDVLYTTDTTVTTSSRFYRIPRIEPDGEAAISDLAYYFQDNKVMLVPTPTITGTLRLKYFRRPNNLIAVSDAALIASVSSTTLVSVSAAPTAIPTGTSCDVIKATGGFDLLGKDTTVSYNPSPADTTWTFGTGVTGMSAGDYVCAAGDTCVPQIPFEFQGILAQRVAVKCLEALGDREGMSVAQAKLMEMEKNAFDLITPRDHGTPRKAVAPFYPASSWWR